MRVHVWTLCQRMRKCVGDCTLRLLSVGLFNLFVFWQGTRWAEELQYVTSHSPAFFLTPVIYHYRYNTVSIRIVYHFTDVTSCSHFTTVGYCTFTVAGVKSPHLNCNAGKTGLSLNALCDVLAANTQALRDGTCHPLSLQSCPHFTLTDEAWFCLIT